MQLVVSDIVTSELLDIELKENSISCIYSTIPLQNVLVSFPFLSFLFFSSLFSSLCLSFSVTHRHKAGRR